MDDSSETEKIELNGVRTVVVVETNEYPGQLGENGLPDEGRETWGKKADFLLSVIGFAVDLANVWRFPYLCYRNGGGAFLIPYLLMLIFGGIPLFYMELALGQYIRKGAITCWGRICPLFKGVGYTVVMIAFFTDFFYNVVIAWSLYYLFASFTSNLPWTSCNNTWNSDTCTDAHLKEMNRSVLPVIAPTVVESTTFNLSINATSNETKVIMTYPADEFYNFAVLGISEGYTLTNLGMVQWKLALCLLVVYIICYFSLWKGISMSGKVVWFTAIFPYVVLFILLIRGVTLEGSMAGIQYYITPKLEKLKEGRAWLDAATQVFFSLGPGFGVLLAYASYNRFDNNVYRDALFTSAINSATSFMSGFVVFSVLGYMAIKRNVDIENVVDEGPGLVFAVYPEALATLPASNFWSVLFFMMLLTLGLDSSFGGSEAVITALSDEFPIVKRRREIFVLILFVFYFCIGLMEVTQGGIYLFTLFERYCVQYSILIAVFFEAIIVSWIYGVDRFRGNIKEMTGFCPGIYWKVCWKYIAPIFIIYNIIYGLHDHQPLTLKGWPYPAWSNAIGWILAMLSIFFIPFIAVVQIIKTPGSFTERITLNLKPYQDTHGLKHDHMLQLPQNPDQDDV